ncbi:FG-GAP repeat domain-containing protein [Nitrospina watsonii]|uniref:VCBS repeat-containing protein n=1 Tax=Nitrospina watsonii TaxID=1323948 RepID=A0ABM9HEC2_9BACT|nr:VCBS repeat-containing protein [Nitrospina watsonii]CAI2718560.1 VCBS repeat-containing protein [Nitrospina watsonii]
MGFTNTRGSAMWLGVFAGLLGWLGGCNFSMPEPPPDVFSRYNTLKVGWGPVFLAHGDFNRDGNADLVVANSKDHSLSFLFGKGDGTFQPAQDLKVPVEPSFIVVTDLNHDENPDLIFNSEGNQTFQVLLGKGQGTFQPMWSVPTGPVPLALIVGDFNADGHKDVAVTLTFSKVEIHFGNGDGGFKRGETYETGSRSISGVAGDFNDDGHEDLLLAVQSSNSSSIRFFSGNSGGTLRLTGRFAEDLRCLTLLKEDMNGDGLYDLVATSAKGDNLYYIPMGTNGKFGRPVSFSGGGGPISLAVGDFDGDHHKDVVVANSRSSSFSLITRHPNGAFRFPVRDYVTGSTPLAIVSTDFNNDGLSDVAVASNTEGTVDIFLGRRVMK